MKEPPQIWNLDDIEQRRKLMSQVSKLRGLHEVSIKLRRRTRTLKQNKYYWVAVAAVFAEWLRESQGDPFIDAEQAHEILKIQILGYKEIVNKETGEVVLVPPRTRGLTTMEFWDYVENASAWLASFAEIIVIPPKEFYEEPDEQKQKVATGDAAG